MELAKEKIEGKSVVVPFRLPKRLHDKVRRYAEQESAKGVQVYQADVLRAAVDLFFSVDRFGNRNDSDKDSDTNGGDE